MNMHVSPRVGRSVLIVVPCLNESRYIAKLLGHLIEMADDMDARIVVADGGSSDRTREIVSAVARRDPRVVLIDNPGRYQSAGVNLAVRMFGDEADVLIRMDAHSGYPTDYCRGLIEEADAIGADSVVVGMRTVGMTCFQRAVAAAQNSWLGTGGSYHRVGATAAFVDHGHHALMRIGAFRAVGGYDETFSHNEDAELDVRLRASGCRIWLTAKFGLVYFPRDTISGLFRQYRNYGRGRARTQRKHRMLPKLRQFGPAGVVPACVAAVLSLPLALLSGHSAALLLALPALLWAVGCLLAGGMFVIVRAEPCSVFSGVAAMVMHFAWSLGYWSGLLRPTVDR